MSIGNEIDHGLDSSLLNIPVEQLTRDAIVSEFWDSLPNNQQKLNIFDTRLETYWAYYGRECNNALHDGGRHVAARTHRDIVETVSKLKAGMKREDIKASLQLKLTTWHANEDELLNNTIDLAASLLLMMSYGFNSYGFSGRRQVQWTNGSLQDFVHRYFQEDPSLIKEHVKLERIFNARNLGRIAGLEIVWTDNLVDHLRLADDDKSVHIFHHASFLELQRIGSTLLPEGLADEVLRTLALLFPSADPEVKKWFFRLPDASLLDERVVKCGHLRTDHRQIDKFKFFRDRLVTLKQVFDEAHPKTLSQWWHDRRNGVQWYTFWVAVLVLLLTVFFGLIQCIEGGLQAYASFKALQTPGGSGTSASG